MPDYYIDLRGEEAVPVPHTNKRGRRNSEDLLSQSRPHDWFANPKQRLLLFYLKRCYKYDLENFTKIFNFAFAEELTEGSLPKSKLGAQLSDQKTLQVSFVNDFLDVPNEYLEKIYGSIRDIIVNAAKVLRITLVRSDAAGRLQADRNKLKRKARASTTNSDSDSSIDMSVHGDSEDDAVSKATKKTAASFARTNPSIPRVRIPQDTAGLPTPSQSHTTTPQFRKVGFVRARHGSQLLPALALTPPGKPTITHSQTTNASGAVRLKSSRSAEISSHDGVPYLLFRCWDATSHGTNSVAAFASGLRIGETPMVDTDPDFLRYALAHLEYRPQPSPFVSFTTSLPTALRKAAHKLSDVSFPTLTVLDGRAVALQTRLYHTRAVIDTLRARNIPTPRYPSGGQYEYWAWGRTDCILGQVSLQRFQEWTQEDDCLGALLIQNDLGNMGVPAFRQRCRHALAVDASLGRSISSLARLFRPTASEHDPFLKDFARIILQNLDLVNDLNEWEANIDFTAGLFLAPAPLTTRSTPQHAFDSQDAPQDNDDGFEDIDDVIGDVGDATVEGVNLTVATDGGLESPITIEDDDDHDFTEHAMVVEERSDHRRTDPPSVVSAPRQHTRRRERTPQTPLAHRTRLSSISSDELTISLPPSPYDTMRAQMRIAAQQASPTPAPRALPSAVEDLEDLQTMPAIATQQPIPWLDREAAMQQMVSVMPPAERERWTLAFDMYVKGLVTDVLAERHSD